MSVSDDPLRRPALWVFLVLLLAFALYAPSLANDFTWDDRWAAMGDNGQAKHPLVSELRPLGDYFATHWWPHKTPVSHTFRPISTLSFALGHAAFGDRPLPAHLINVLLHTLAVGLCCALLHRLGLGWPAACLGALVFGAHAIHSEAVANLVGRAELLAFDCGALGCLALEAALRRGGLVKATLAVLAAGLCFLACGAKESAVAWVAFTPLYLWARAGFPRRVHRDALLVAAAVALPALAFLVLRARLLASLPALDDPSIGGLENPLLDAPALTRVLTGVVAWGQGLLLTFLPLDLAADWGPCMLPIVDSPAHPGFLVAGLALSAVLAGGFVLARRHPALLLAAAAFLGFSFVVTNIPFPVFMLLAERTYFTPSLGLALAVAWAVQRRGPRPALLGAIALWVLASGTVALTRNGVWRDDETLIAHEVAAHPRSVRFRLCAGVLCAARGDPAGARVHLTEAAELAPRAPQPWLELARVALLAGDRAAAATAARRALAGWPRDVARIEAEARAILAQALARPAATPR